MRAHALAATMFSAVLFAGVVSAQTPTPTPAPDDHASVNQRLENQKDRIQAGTKDDQLTKGERARLKADDKAIHAEARADRKANNGTLTTGEKKQINRQLNRTSRKINRARHNARTPRK